MVCWCETNTKEKTQAVADEEQAIIDWRASRPSFVIKQGLGGD